MKIHSPKEKYIVIELNRRDMEQLNLCYADMDYSDESTRKAIFSVLSQVKKSLGQNFDLSDTLRVEALPRENGGCLLFFTIGEKQRRYRVLRRTATAVFVFEDVDLLLDSAAELTHNDISGVESRLFCDSGIYYLFLDGKIRRALIEKLSGYAYHMRKSQLPFLSDECCKIRENALEILCGGISE